MTSADPIPMLCHPLWECGELPPCELLPLGPPPGGPGGPPDEELDELSLPRGMAVAVSTFGLPFWDCFGSTLGFHFGTVSAPPLGLDLLGISLVIVLGETLHKLTLHHMVAWLSESS